MILLIKHFGMSCHKAAKVVGIPYNNAKMIFRIYTREKRIKQVQNSHKRSHKRLAKRCVKADERKEKELKAQARVKLLINEVDSDTDIDSEDRNASKVQAHEKVTQNSASGLQG